MKSVRTDLITISAAVSAVLLLLFSENISGQSILKNAGYQYIIMNNPAFAGSNQKGSVRLSYINNYPGNSYNLHTMTVTADSYVPVLHGGLSGYIYNDYMGGIINDLRAGFSWSYFLKAGRDLYINAGLSGSAGHRGYNFGNAILPDQIDPVSGVLSASAGSFADRGHTFFDLGAGMMFITDGFFGGISVMHLTEPSLSGKASSEDKLPRTLFFHGTADVPLSADRSMRLRPELYSSFSSRRIDLAVGAVAETDLLSLEVLLITGSGASISSRTGLSMDFGKLNIFYNFMFSIYQGANLLPFALMHEAGISLSLRSVNKRNNIRTINFPK